VCRPGVWLGVRRAGLRLSPAREPGQLHRATTDRIVTGLRVCRDRSAHHARDPSQVHGQDRAAGVSSSAGCSRKRPKVGVASYGFSSFSKRATRRAASSAGPTCPSCRWGVMSEFGGVLVYLRVSEIEIPPAALDLGSVLARSQAEGRWQHRSLIALRSSFGDWRGLFFGRGAHFVMAAETATGTAPLAQRLPTTQAIARAVVACGLRVRRRGSPCP
jgi:hypothetical protein